MHRFMKQKLSIRKRIFTGLVSLGLLSSACFALVIKFSTDFLEEEIIQSTYTDEFSAVLDSLSSGEKWLPNSSHTLGFLASQGKVPTEFIRYTTGQYHEVLWNNKKYHLFVSPIKDDTFYLALQIEAIERYEEQLNIVLLIVFVSLSFTSVWLALWFTGLIAKPVTALAYNVSQLQAGDAQLSGSVADSELIAIESSINSYLALIQDHLRKEKLFSGIASHELRTPISTIRSSVEILLENTDSNNTKQLQRLQRIQRASLEMTFISDSLLSFIKNDNQLIECQKSNKIYALEKLITQITKEQQPLLRNKDVSLNLNINERAETSIKPDIIKIIVGNLVRNALQNTLHGEVLIQLHNNRITITDTGLGTPQEVRAWVNNPNDVDQPYQKMGIGLFIVVLLCQQLNIDIHAEALGNDTTGSKFTLNWN